MNAVDDHPDPQVLARLVPLPDPPGPDRHGHGVGRLVGDRLDAAAEASRLDAQRIDQLQVVVGQQRREEHARRLQQPATHRGHPADERRAPATARRPVRELHRRTYCPLRRICNVRPRDVAWVRPSRKRAYPHRRCGSSSGRGPRGRAIDALYQENDVTVIDTNADRLTALADRYDVRTVEGNGTTKRVIREAGIQNCSLFIASTSREEANLVSAMLVKKLSGSRVGADHERRVPGRLARARDRRGLQLVSSELETANAISGLIGIPAARQTDVFADGKVPGRRVRRAAGRGRQRRGRPQAARRRAARGLEGREHHPRRRARVAGRRAADPRGRPDRGHRLTGRARASGAG